MQKELSYTSSIKDMPFLFPEMRRTAQLLCAGKTPEDIVQFSMTENIYQLEKEKRRRDVPLRMLKRLQTIEESLVAVVADGRDDEAKLIAFLALIKADRLLFEFMREVYADRFYSGREEITDQDYLEFIERKTQNSDVVAKWTSNNLVRIRNTYKNILCEAGLAKRSGDLLTIQKPIADHELLSLLGDGNKLYAKAMLLEV